MNNKQKYIRENHNKTNGQNSTTKTTNLNKEHKQKFYLIYQILNLI